MPADRCVRPSWLSRCRSALRLRARSAVLNAGRGAAAQRAAPCQGGCKGSAACPFGAVPSGRPSLWPFSPPRRLPRAPAIAIKRALLQPRAPRSLVRPRRTCGPAPAAQVDSAGAWCAVSTGSGGRHGRRSLEMRPLRIGTARRRLPSVQAVLASRSRGLTSARSCAAARSARKIAHPFGRAARRLQRRPSACTAFRDMASAGRVRRPVQPSSRTLALRDRSGRLDPGQGRAASGPRRPRRRLQGSDAPGPESVARHVSVLDHPHRRRPRRPPAFKSPRRGGKMDVKAPPVTGRRAASTGLPVTASHLSVTRGQKKSRRASSAAWLFPWCCRGKARSAPVRTHKQAPNGPPSPAPQASAGDPGPRPSVRLRQPAAGAVDPCLGLARTSELCGTVKHAFRRPRFQIGTHRRVRRRRWGPQCARSPCCASRGALKKQLRVAASDRRRWRLPNCVRQRATATFNASADRADAHRDRVKRTLRTTI